MVPSRRVTTLRHNSTPPRATWGANVRHTVLFEYLISERMVQYALHTTRKTRLSRNTPRVSESLIVARVPQQPYTPLEQ